MKGLYDMKATFIGPDGWPATQASSHQFAITISPSNNSRGSLLAALLALSLLTPLTLAATASAAAPDFLLQIPADSTVFGSGAGQLNNPRGMVANPDTGHLYVAEHENGRISEFTAWGAFVKAWGWDVAPEGAPGDTPADQLEVCATSCQAGIEGSGTGQFNRVTGITLDSSGDIHVYDRNNRRVQKFSPSGQFLLMFGGEVNQGPNHPGNVCTAQHITEGDTCGAGTAGTAAGQFFAGDGNYLTYNPQTDSIFVGDVDRIQEFSTDGSFEGKIDFEGSIGTFDGKSVSALASDPVSGDLYLALSGAEGVHRLDPATGELLDTLEVASPQALAVDVDGNVYAVDADPNNNNVAEAEVLGFDASGKPIAGMEDGDLFAKPPDKTSFEQDFLLGLATNVIGPGSDEPGDLYIGFVSSGFAAYLNAYGPPPIDFEPPPPAPPEIKAQ
jgi:DNA-binding beta-propeller fold protein YncE